MNKRYLLVLTGIIIAFLIVTLLWRLQVARKERQKLKLSEFVSKEKPSAEKVEPKPALVQIVTTPVAQQPTPLPEPQRPRKTEKRFPFNGIVRDYQTLKPIDKARVILCSSEITRDPDTAPLVETTTDNKGNFLLYLQDPPYGIIKIKKPGYASMLYLLREAHYLKQPFEFYLMPGSTIEGMVKDDQGRPIAGAKVGPTTPEPGSVNIEQKVFRCSSEWATTDESGHFRLANLIPGRYSFNVHASGYLPQRIRNVETGTKGWEIVLKQGGGSIAGVVLVKRSQRPIPDCKVGLEYFAEENHFVLTANNDKAGRFQFTALPPGKYYFNVRYNNMKFYFVHKKIELAESQHVKDVKLEVHESVVVSGQVLEKDTETPIAGAEISHISRLSTKKVLTDTQGRFLIPDFYPTIPEGKLRLWAKADGYVSLRDNITYQSQTTSMLDIRDKEKIEGIIIYMFPAVQIQGVVKDPEQSPVQGAVIYMHSSPSLDYTYSSQGTDITDENGQFCLSLKPTQPTTCRFLALHPSYGITESELIKITPQDRVRGVELQYSATASLSGLVVDNKNNPIGEAEVRLRFLSESLPQPSRTSGFFVRYSETNKNGDFEFGGVQPGKYELTAQAAGYTLSQPMIIELNSGDKKEEIIQLVWGHYIAGRVINEEEAPVAIATVQVTYSSFGAWEERLTRTDDEGKYVIDGLPDVRINMEVIHGDYITQQKRDVAVDSDEVNFTLVRQKKACGRVIYAHNKNPVTEFEILPLRFYRGQKDYDIARSPQSVRDTEGRFSLPSLDTGRYKILARTKDNYIGLSPFINITAEAKPPGEINIEVELALTIKGKVIDKTTEVPIEQVEVSLDCRGLGGFYEEALPRTTITNEQGEFVLQGQFLGRHALYLSHPEYVRGFKQEIEIAPEEIKEITVYLNRGGVIEGKVIGREGKPLPGANLHIWSPADECEVSVSTVTDPDGHYIINRLPAGVYYVSLRHRAAQFPPAQITLTEDETKELNFDLSGKTLVYGQFTDSEGNPLAGAYLYFRQIKDLSGSPVRKTSKVMVNITGNYEIQLSPGWYKIMVNMPVERRFFDLVQEIKIPALDKFELNLSTQGAIIYGVVLDDQTGQPIGNCRITLLKLPEATTEQEPRMIGHCATNGNGKFRFEGLQPGQYELEATKVGYLPVKEYLVELNYDNEEKEIELRMQSSGVVELRVIDEDTRDVLENGAIYRVNDSQGQKVSTFATDYYYPQKITLGGLPDGIYHLLVGENSFYYVKREIEVEIKTGEKNQLTIPLAKGGQLKVSFSPEAEDIFQNYQLILRDSSGSMVFDSRVHPALSDGEYSKIIGGFLPRQYIVSYKSVNYQAVEKSVIIVKDQQSRITLELQPKPEKEE